MRTVDPHLRRLVVIAERLLFEQQMNVLLTVDVLTGAWVEFVLTYKLWQTDGFD